MTIQAGQIIRASDFPDSGLQPLTLTPGTGWGIDTATYRRVGDVVTIYLWFLRTGATITGPANGDIPNEVMGTITDTALRPQQQMWVSAASSSLAGVRVNTDGTVLLFALHANATISASNHVDVSATYLVAT